MDRLGLVSATFKEKSVEEVISIAKNAGLTLIEWSENHHIKEGDEQKARDVLLMCEDNGIKIAEFGSYYRLGQNHDFSSRIKVAKALNTSSIRIWAGDKPSKSYGSEERKALVKEAKEIAKRAQDEDLIVVTEWHKNTLTDENGSALAFFEEVGSPAFKTLWQPTQALSVEERIEGIKMARPYIKGAHVYYWDESGRRPLKEGRDVWSRYIGQMPENSFYLLEFVMNNTSEQFYLDAEELKTWFR